MYKIDRPNLIKSDSDHFNLYPKVEGMTSFLENIHSKEVLKHNNLVALYGEWGSGKSSVITTVNDKLNKDKFNYFIFEAWKYEKDDNLPFSIFEAIMDNIIGDRDAAIEILKEGFWEGLKSFANGITVKTKYVNVSLKDMKPSEIEESLYTKIENFIDGFKKLLDKYSKGKTTVIFIDDLDRCEDESIINLLVALKLMFTLENVIFVCCIDKIATIEALKRKYNNNQEKAESFLDKLFLFDFNIVPIEGDTFIKIEDKLETTILLEVFKRFDIKNPRKIKKIINKIVMLKEFTKDSDYDEAERGMYFSTIYYFLALKEVDFWGFNKILNFSLDDISLYKSTRRVKNTQKKSYINIKRLSSETEHEEDLEHLNIIIDKLIYLFSDLFLEKIGNSDEKILKVTPLKEAIELLKKYV